jgi:hypothetical protein
MAGNLNSAAPGFTSMSIGSGHSLGGGNYPAGTPVYASVYTTFNTSAATVVASGDSTQTFTATGFGPGDYIGICSGATALPQSVLMRAYLSASSQGSIVFSNLSGATETVPVTTVVVHLAKITP